MPLHPRTCTLLYSISCLLDALDGYAARKYEQSTKFGAVLDMVTDRCTTTCLLVFLAQAFPRWSIVFQGLISLDLASHYMHMYATLSMGGTNQSHKNVDESRSWLLKQYYSNNVRPQHHHIHVRSWQGIGIWNANRFTESPLHILRHERNLLHRPLPALLLLAPPLPNPLLRHQQPVLPPARFARRPKALYVLRQPFLRGGYGDGARE
jgi:hypothetical protein